MGNFKSRSSSGKDLPSYNYDESVLNNAQENFPDTESTSGVVVDEEYYSAEEGDSICSVTPERTRSESSSAQGSPVTSDDDDYSDESCSPSESDEESSFVSEEEQLLPAEALKSSITSGADVSSQDGYSQCNSQEENSFKLQFKNADILNKSCVNLKDKTRINQDIILNCRARATSSAFIEQTVSRANSPSFTNKKLEVHNTASDSNENVLRLKEDVSQSSESISGESSSPTNRMLIIRSLKRRHIEYLISSESENDETENTTRHKFKRQRMMSSQRRNRSRHVRYSRNRRKSVSCKEDVIKKMLPADHFFI